MNILFVTGNKNKLEEVQRIVGNQFNVTSANLDIPEIQSTNVTEVVIDKAKRAFDITREPVMCEDTGVHIKQMNSFPGALIKFYLRDLKNEGIAKLNGGSEAFVETAICYYDGATYNIFKGRIDGHIATTVRGSGFGWDPIFIPQGKDFSFAECPTEIKDELSMRKIALHKMIKHFCGATEALL